MRHARFGHVVRHGGPLTPSTLPRAVRSAVLVPVVVGLFDGHPWAVNNQAPDHALIDYDNWATDYPSTPTEPRPSRTSP